MRNRSRKPTSKQKKNKRKVRHLSRAVIHEQRTNKPTWYQEAAAVDVEKLRRELSIAQLRLQPLTFEERLAAKTLLDQKRRKIAKREDMIDAHEKRAKNKLV